MRMQVRGEWPPAGWLAEEARGSEQAPLAKLPGGFLGWAAGVQLGWLLGAG
jgi:hypothetical protein